jgi:hypothetical protein
MCVQVTKTANRFEISSLLEKILLKQVRWCLTFVGLYILYLVKHVSAEKHYSSVVKFKGLGSGIRIMVFNVTFNNISDRGGQFYYSI